MIKLLNKKDFNFEVSREVLKNSSGKDTGHDCIFRSDNGSNLGVVSRDYKLLKHEYAINSVLEQFDKKNIGVENVKSEITRNGARGFFTFNIPTESYNLAPMRKVGDIISPGFIISNSYDRSIRFGLQSFVYRLVCKNGMMAKDIIHNEKKRHIRTLQESEVTVKFINATENMKKEYFPAIKDFTQKEMKSTNFQKEINLLPGWLQEESLSQLEEQNFISIIEEGKEKDVEIIKEFTIWDFLNTLTYSLTHSDKSSPENRIALGREVSERLLIF